MEFKIGFFSQYNCMNFLLNIQEYINESYYFYLFEFKFVVNYLIEIFQIFLKTDLKIIILIIFRIFNLEL